MKLKALVSKKVVTLALAGTIGLGAVGTATYAAAPGIVDKIVNSYINNVDRDLNSYKADVAKYVPSYVSNAYNKAYDSFSTYYTTKREEAKKKIDDDVQKYAQEQGAITDEERKDAQARIQAKLDKKSAEITAELKAQVDAEFKK